jgi:hypothetical protein
MDGHVALIYSKKTGWLRRLIYPWVASHGHYVHPGEDILFLARSHYHSFSHFPDIEAHVHKHAGTDPSKVAAATEHYAVGPDGACHGLLRADPSCGDSGAHVAPGHRLIRRVNIDHLDDEEWTYGTGMIGTAFPHREHAARSAHKDKHGRDRQKHLDAGLTGVACKVGPKAMAREWDGGTP